jgi:hypothetical protein
MKLPKIEVTYTEFKSSNYMNDIEGLIEQNKFNSEEFDYFFEVYEDDKVVVFANVYGCDLEEEDVTSGVGRVFQVETAVLVKDIHNSQSLYKMYRLGDSDLPPKLNQLLQNKPVWKADELFRLGVKEILDAYTGFEYDYSWFDYVNQ